MTSQTLLGGIVGAVGHFQKKRADEKAEKKASDALQAERDWQEQLKKMATSEDQFNEALKSLLAEMDFKGDVHARLAFEQEARNRFSKDKADGWAFVEETVERIGADKKKILNKEAIAATPDATDVPVNVIDPAASAVADIVSPDYPEVNAPIMRKPQTEFPPAGRGRTLDTSPNRTRRR